MVRRVGLWRTAAVLVSSGVIGLTPLLTGGGIVAARIVEDSTATPTTLWEVPIEEPAGRSDASPNPVRPDTPFSMVGFRWEGPSPDRITIRVRTEQGWGEPLDIDTAAAQPAPAGGLASEPVWTGHATELDVMAVHLGDPGAPAPALTAVFVNPGTAPSEPTAASTTPGPRTPQPGASRQDDTPGYISRQEWGADESLRCMEPEYDDAIRAATIHHTAGSNDYSKAESVAIVRGIYAYHARTLGWCDIGYHALIDRYGQVFEGRAGGLNRPVVGAHAAGFNHHTTSLAMIGNFVHEEPTEQQWQAAIDYLASRFEPADLDPLGLTSLISTPGGPVPAGAPLQLPVIFGHRDVNHTECPGEAAYRKLGWFREQVAQARAENAEATQPSPPASPPPSASPSGTRPPTSPSAEPTDPVAEVAQPAPTPSPTGPAPTEPPSSGSGPSAGVPAEPEPSPSPPSVTVPPEGLPPSGTAPTPTRARPAPPPHGGVVR